ncbi:MAG: hypothetical protein GY765_32565 [bacterium]|nr:hypothetical protein [bacterium]
MLSKIINVDEVTKEQYTKYVLPCPEDIDKIIAEKKRDAKRRNIIDTNPDDPLKAAKKEANILMLQAQEKLKEAELEANAMKSRQEKKIRAQLEKEFQQKLQAQVQQLQLNYSSSLEVLAALKDGLFKKSEKELMELVFSIVRKVVGEEINSTPDIILTMLDKGFQKIKEAQQYEIIIHPMDYDVLFSNQAGLNEILKTSATISYTKDEKVERGGCIIVTESGEISSEPGKQLDIIIKELANGA